MGALLLWLAIGYLAGSLPTAYLVSRYLQGIDIRRYGSGNVGGANVYTNVAPWAGFLVGAVDAAKAAVPLLVAWQTTGSLWIGVAAGVAAMIGHCWSLYLGFTGGRGMACTLGSLIPVFPIGAVYLIAVHLVGSVVRAAALADLVALATLPLLALVTGAPTPVPWQCLAFVIVVALKRLDANRLPLPRDPGERRAVLRLRLLHDRDVPPGQEWTKSVRDSDGGDGSG